MLRGRGESERGSVAITVALSLTVLLGFAALVVDIGLNWATRTSAQTAADSAALAGASSLLSDGGVAAIGTVEEFLNRNVGGLVELPEDAGWANDGNVGNGEVVCWTMPDPVPVPLPGAICPDDANALQVTTPPIVVRYAFAPLLGKTTSSIRARAAAGAGPAAPNNCVLCVLDPDDDGALEVLGAGGIEVDGGGIVVNSEDDDAVVLLSAGDIIANQIRVVGGVDDRGVGQLLPPAEQGGPPVPDPLADLLTAGRADPTARTGGGPGAAHRRRRHPRARRLRQHQRALGRHPDPGGRGLRGHRGRRVPGQARRPGARRRGHHLPGLRRTTRRRATTRAGPGSGWTTGASSWPARRPPASTPGCRSSPTAATPGRTLLLGDVDLTGAVYTASSRLRVFSTSAVQIDSLLVVDRLQSVNLAPLEVNYDPSLPLPGVGRPVLIQ